MQSRRRKGHPHAWRAAAVCGAVLAALAPVAPVGAAAARPAQPARARLVADAAQRVTAGGVHPLGGPAVVPAAVTETAKVTLPETSIAGPGLSGAGIPNFEIAWTGTDPAHHLNVRSGTDTDGLHFPTKTTLAETSPDGPALAEISIGPAAGFAVAWRGTDPGHLLNVETFVVAGGTPVSKLILPETSFAAPALVGVFPQAGGQSLLLAWTGSDPNNSLNVMAISLTNAGVLGRGTKTVLPQFSSNAGPSLGIVGVPSGNEFVATFVLGWSTRATQQLNLAESTDGVHFASALGSGLPQTSATAPHIFDATPGRPCLGWTGTDPAHHLNVQCTTQFPQFPDPAHTQTVLPETAFGAPGLTGSGNNVLLLGWTGTDPAHHLNVARLQVS